MYKMRRLRVYIAAHDKATSGYHICDVIVCRDSHGVFLIEPHCFDYYYSPANRRVHEEGYCIEYYVLFDRHISMESRGITVAAEKLRLAVECGENKYYFTEPLYDL